MMVGEKVPLSQLNLCRCYLAGFTVVSKASVTAAACALSPTETGRKWACSSLCRGHFKWRLYKLLTVVKRQERSENLREWNICCSFVEVAKKSWVLVSGYASYAATSYSKNYPCVQSLLLPGGNKSFPTLGICLVVQVLPLYLMLPMALDRTFSVGRYDLKQEAEVVSKILISKYSGGGMCAHVLQMW